MKNICLAIACVLFLLPQAGVFAQDFKTEGSSALDLYDPGEDQSVVSAEGDMNKDGVKDLVLFVTGYASGDNFAFYFGNKQGGYTLFRSYPVGMYRDVKLSVTDAGVARIQHDLEEKGADIFLFRFENGDFRLIGGKEDRHTSAHYDVSYNYLTGKMIRTDGEGKSRKSTTLDMPALPKLHFGWIPLDYDMLGYLLEETEDGPLDPEYLTVMGIFRVMQNEEMLFWSFCDWENDYHNPMGDDETDGWIAFDSYESPGSYNAYSQLRILKMKDGSYSIHLSESHYDRTYEQYFNEDLSNIDEVMEEYESEEEVTETDWIFKDGKFTVLAKAE